MESTISKKSTPQRPLAASDDLIFGSEVERDRAAVPDACDLPLEVKTLLGRTSTSIYLLHIKQLVTAISWPVDDESFFETASMVSSKSFIQGRWTF